MEHTITFDAAPSHANTATLWKGISENAKLIKGFEPGKPFAFFIKDKMGSIKGGCSGFIFYGCLYTDLLWVDKSLREKGYGTDLMGRVEKLAIDNSCRFMVVNTMDFEALNFYKKLGYMIEFERRGFEKDSIMYFLRKNLMHAPSNAITFEIIRHNSSEYKKAVSLREKILRKPLGLIFTDDELLAEKEHVHIVGTANGEIIATAVLVPEDQQYKMQRVVVKEGVQSQGIGSQMMNFCEKYVVSQDGKSIYCHARDSAVNFYIKNGYVAKGDYFDEDTIPHLKMEKILNK